MEEKDKSINMLKLLIVCKNDQWFLSDDGLRIAKWVIQSHLSLWDSRLLILLASTISLMQIHLFLKLFKIQARAEVVALGALQPLPFSRIKDVHLNIN